MTTPALVGRIDELRALTELVDRARNRGGSLVLVGEAGVGKSGLIRAAAQHARHAGLRVLEGVGVEAEARLPFAGLHQLLRPLLSAGCELPAVQRRALLSAFGAEDGPPAEPFMITLAALSLLTNAAVERPVAVFVDDVQWLDQGTQDVLAFVARRVGSDPVIIVGSVRTGYSGPFLTAGLPELQVLGLDDASARQVLARHGDHLSHADRERILRAALGNPLALVELPAAWPSAAEPGVDLIPPFLRLTARLERAFAGRVAELPAATRDAVLVAAVDSVDELPEILAGASVLAGRQLRVDVLESATAAGLLRFDTVRVHFRHPLVRSAVLQSETVARWQAANAALAAVLANEPYRRTWHRAQSIVGPDDEVADELEASHRVSLRRGSVTTAIWALERAAQLTTDPARRGRRLLLAAEHAFGLGRADMVDRLLTAASRTPLSDLDTARMEWLREIFHDGVPGDAARILQLCDIAARSMAADDADLALNLLLGAALRCWWADAGPAARARVVQVTRQLRGVQDDPRYVATLAVAEPVLEARTVIDLLSRIVIENVADANALRLLGAAAHAVGEPARAVDFLERSETKLREQGRLGLLSHVLAMQILDRIELGDWDRAEALAEESRRLAQQTGQPIWATGTLLVHTMVIALRGDNPRAQSQATDAEYAAHGRRLTDLLACVQLARGLGWLGAGQHTEAYQALRRLFDPADPSFHQTERFRGVMFLAEAAVRAERRDDARAVIADLEEVARTTPSATLRVQLSYARAVLADDENAERNYLAALGEDLVRWPWTKARLELAYGSWLRRQRRVAESRAPLRAALTTFDLIRATGWAEQARAELRATGERLATGEGYARDRSAAETLSAQELQIARLAAQGLSNKEIGQRLFLSPRTIGSHLYRIFPKLNISSRTQLASLIDAA